MIFEDTPNFWDAWGVSIIFVYRRSRSEVICSDVEIHHLEKRQPLKFGHISVLEEGPLRAAVLAELKYGKSSINVVVRCLLPFWFVCGVTIFYLQISLHAVNGLSFRMRSVHCSFLSSVHEAERSTLYQLRSTCGLAPETRVLEVYV